MRQLSVRDPPQCVFELVGAERPNVPVQRPLQHVDARTDEPVVGDHRTPMEVGMTDFVGEIAPRPLAEAGEVAPEFEDQAEVGVSAVEFVDLRLDHGEIVVDGEFADGTHRDHTIWSIGDRFEHPRSVDLGVAKRSVIGAAR